MNTETPCPQERVDSSPMLADLEWSTIVPNEHGDWINQRSKSFAIHLAANADNEASMFGLRTRGLSTSRDAWNYSSSRRMLDANVTRMMENYNTQVAAFAEEHPQLTGSLKERAEVVKKFVDLDPTKFSWDRANFIDVARGTTFSDADRLVLIATYRPFHRRWVEAGRRLNNTIYQLPRVFPDATSENLAIAVSTIGARTAFSTYMTRDLPDVHLWVDDTPCFPLYVYDTKSADSEPLPGMSRELSAEGRKHNVTDHALDVYRTLDRAIEKDDIFFYVYGIFHSPDYRSAFAADLKKSLPRIPQVSTADEFWAFSKAGRDLAHLHTEYETVEPWPELKYQHAEGFNADHPDAYRVLKMKHPKTIDPASGEKVEDRTRIVYNDWITVGNIPERAYAYELGSRSAIDWVMESWRVRTDKASGIVNDPNDWAIERANPTYILDLLGRVVTVSIRTLDTIDALPHLDL